MFSRPIGHTLQDLLDSLDDLNLDFLGHVLLNPLLDIRKQCIEIPDFRVLGTQSLVTEVLRVLVPTGLAQEVEKHGFQSGSSVS